jgi:hypothetical protein
VTLRLTVVRWDARELAFIMQHDYKSSEGLALLVRLTPTGPTPGRNPYQRNLRHARGTGPQSVLPLPASGEVVRMADVRFELKAGHRYAVELRVLQLADGAVSDAYYQVAVREQEPQAGRMPAVPGKAEAEDLTQGREGRKDAKKTKAKAEALPWSPEDTAERRRNAEAAYVAQMRERRQRAEGAPGKADASGGAYGELDENVNVVVVTPQSHPELWRWQDGYRKHFPQWNSMDYYEAVRTED